MENKRQVEVWDWWVDEYERLAYCLFTLNGKLFLKESLIIIVDDKIEDYNGE